MFNSMLDTINPPEITGKKGRKPRNAMSYFSSSLAKHGKKGSRPKVEMPENTESACRRLSNHIEASCSCCPWI